MALTWDDLSGKTHRKIVPVLVDNVFKSSPPLTRLRTRRAMEFTGGREISQPIMYNKLKGGAYPRGGSFDTSYVQTDTNMVILPKFYYVNVTLFGQDNVLQRGPEAAMDYVRSKMVNAAGTMAENLATDMYLDGQGSSSSIIQLDGFQAAVDDGTNFTSYGQITRSDIAAGANVGINAYYASVPTLSITAFQTAFGATWFGNESVDLITMTQAVWNIFERKLQPQQRFLDENSDVAKAGFQAIRWHGATLTVDQYQPSGTIFGINTKYVQFWMSTLPLHQFGFTGFKEAQNTIDVAGQYLFAGNLLVTAPRLCFRLVGITG
jgi:hypothetical protein